MEEQSRTMSREVAGAQTPKPKSPGTLVAEGLERNLVNLQTEISRLAAFADTFTGEEPPEAVEDEDSECPVGWLGLLESMVGQQACRISRLGKVVDRLRAII